MLSPPKDIGLHVSFLPYCLPLLSFYFFFVISCSSFVILRVSRRIQSSFLSYCIEPRQFMLFFHSIETSLSCHPARKSQDPVLLSFLLCSFVFSSSVLLLLQCTLLYCRDSCTSDRSVDKSCASSVHTASLYFVFQ